MGVDSVRQFAPADGRTLAPRDFVVFVRRMLGTGLLEGEWDRLEDREPGDPPCTTHWISPPYALYTGAWIGQAYGWNLDPHDPLTAERRVGLALRYDGSDLDALLAALETVVENDDVAVWCAALDTSDDEMRHLHPGCYSVLIQRTREPQRLAEYSAYLDEGESLDRACEARTWITVSGRRVPMEEDIVATPFGDAIRDAFGELWTASIDM